MERSQFLTVLFCHFFHNVLKGSIINIHVCNKDKTRQFILVAQFPGFFGTHFNACFTGYNDDRCISCANCFFYFTDKIKESGSIQNIDLNPLPLNRNNRCTDGNLSLLLFFTIVTYGISILHFAHTGCDSGKISHRLYQCCLTASPMPQQNYITNFVSCVNIHIKALQFTLYWDYFTINLFDNINFLRPDSYILLKRRLNCKKICPFCTQLFDVLKTGHFPCLSTCFSV